MDQRKNKQSEPRQQVKTTKSTNELLKLIDNNQKIFQQLKTHLLRQINAYQMSFSRQQNKYTEERDFDYFHDCCQKFKLQGKHFVDKLLQIKNNCSTVIKNLPQQQKIIPVESHNSFDMFVNQQIDKTLQIKLKGIQYENDAQKPFQNQLQQFQNQ